MEQNRDKAEKTRAGSAQQQGFQEHPFPALYDKDSRILILGSFPSVKSREQQFFYGHPQNRFWKTLAGVLSEPVPETVEEKKHFLKNNHIALWDVIRSCEITGSSDGSIRNVVPNDLSEIVSAADIRRIYCNGSVSYRYYCRYQEKALGIKAVKLPSTSPANAAWSLPRLIREWMEICTPLGAVPPDMAKALLAWYDYNARVLPWRSDPKPYHVWLSEIMLQQTRVETAAGYYMRFLERFPSIGDLAEASEEELMKLWEGLGYYRRARHLRQAALQVREEYDGELPSDYESLLKLPGIGEYTAGAISSIAFRQRQPAVDGNVLRVYARLLGDRRDISSSGLKKDVRREVLRSMPEERPGDFNQALMDLGASVCLPNGKPKCEECPLDTICTAHRLSKETDYPVKKKKSGRRIEHKTILRMELGDKLVLHKRPQEGLLAGLWELPNLEGVLTVQEMKDLLEQWGISGYELASLGPGKHIFSHVEWRMKGYRVTLEHLPEKLIKERQWILADPDQIEATYAIPSAFERYR